MATVSLFRETQALLLICTLAMSAKPNPWICIHIDRTSRARCAGTSTTTLDVVPFSPTTSIGSTTVVPARAAIVKAEEKTPTARIAARHSLAPSQQRGDDAPRSKRLSGICIGGCRVRTSIQPARSPRVLDRQFLQAAQVAGHCGCWIAGCLVLETP